MYSVPQQSLWVALVLIMTVHPPLSAALLTSSREGTRQVRLDMLEDVAHRLRPDQFSQPADDPGAQHLVLEGTSDELGLLVIAGQVCVRRLE